MCTFNAADYRVFFLNLDKNDLKAYNYIFAKKKTQSLLDIVSITEEEVKEISNDNKNKYVRINEFLHKLNQEIQAHKDKVIDLDLFQGKYIAPIKLSDQLPMEDVDFLLNQDVLFYICNINNKRDKEILETRFGFGVKKETLEFIGGCFDITRERVRQVQSKEINNLKKNIRFSSEFLQEIVERDASINLLTMFPALYDNFFDEESFYEFLGVIANKPKLATLISPDVSSVLLDDYFAENGGPQQKIDLINYVESSINGIKGENVLSVLAKEKKIFIDGDLVFPMNLSKNLAVSYVLASYPEGLHWEEIAKLVNATQVSRHKVYSDRVDTHALTGSEYTYLSGRGKYKHLQYMSIAPLNEKDISNEIKNYLNSTKDKRVNLYHFYESSNVLKKADYYAVRHIVRTIGEDYGLYFNGKSSADTVSLDKKVKLISQKDVVLKHLMGAKKPLNKIEIAKVIKSASVNHAGFYLDVLIKEGKVVIESATYTTPEKLFKNIDVNICLNLVDVLLDEYKRPVDVSIIANHLNSTLNLNNSEQFYYSLARCYLGRYGWHRKYNVFSKKPIMYDSLTDAMQELCTSAAQTDVDYEFFNSHIAISKEKFFTRHHTVFYNRN